jgi:hypothetical protein
MLNGKWVALTLILVVTIGCAVVLGACDNTSNALVPVEALAQLDGDQITKLRSDEELKATVSQVAAESRLIEPGFSAWDEISFESAGEYSYLVAQGKNESGHCVSVALPLATVDGAQKDGGYVVIKKEIGHSCQGSPCDACKFSYVNGEIHGCLCAGTGGGQGPGHCNHSMGEVAPPEQEEVF